jgi:hypothetical protein
LSGRHFYDRRGSARPVVGMRGSNRDEHVVYVRATAAATNCR